jgi:hypothetical protein
MAVRPAAAASVSGTGSANYLPVWDSATDLTSSVIYQSPSGKVGIGINSPADTLVVAGKAVLISAGSAVSSALTGTLCPSGTLHCTRNRKGNFRIGMRTEKSRLRRALMRLQEQMRLMRHSPLLELVNHLNQMLRGHDASH